MRLCVCFFFHFFFSILLWNFDRVPAVLIGMSRGKLIHQSQIHTSQINVTIRIIIGFFLSSNELKCPRSWDDVSKMEGWPVYRCKMSKSTHDYRKDSRKNPVLLGNQSKWGNYCHLQKSTDSQINFIIWSGFLFIFRFFSLLAVANRTVCLCTRNVKILITMWQRHPLDQIRFLTMLNQQLLLQVNLVSS